MKHSLITLTILLVLITGSITPPLSSADTATDNASISGILGSLSDTNPYASTLSSDVRTKLDAFITKVVSLKSSTESIKYTTLLATIKRKLAAFQTDTRYVNNIILQNVLGYLLYETENLTTSSGNTSVSANSSASTSLASVSGTGDLCAEQGLSNIDEENWGSKMESHVKIIMPQWLGHSMEKENDARGFYMGPGESYSFPIDTVTPISFRSINMPYFANYANIVNISDRKCDFTPRKEMNVYRTDGSVFGNKCYLVATGGGGSQRGNGRGPSYSISEKYADPNYKLTNGDGCALIPGKKYYYNVRWLRESDGVFATGKTFNNKGDVCIDSKMCIIAYGFDDTPLLPKLTPSQKTQIETKGAEQMKAHGVWKTTYDQELNSCCAGFGNLCTAPINTVAERIKRDEARGQCTEQANKKAGQQPLID